MIPGQSRQGRKPNWGWRVALACGLAQITAPWIPASAAPPADAPSSHGLEEIVVTATRRELSLSDVPIAISVITAEDLQATGVREFRDYLASIPGVAFSDVGYADAKITVRGVSTDVFSEVRDLTAVYLDEVPISNPGTHPIPQSAMNAYLVDIRQVEMLRGPQGTLFGANSMGGTLRILTNRPDSARFDSFAEASVGVIEHGGENYAVNGMVNLPIGGAAPEEKSSAVRIVGYYDHNAGFIDNIGTGRVDANAADLIGGRAGWKAALSDRLQLEISIAGQQRETEGNNQANLTLPHYRQGTLIDESWQDDWTLYNAVVRYQASAFEFLSSTSFVDRDWRSVSDVSGFLAFFGVDSGTATAIHTQNLQEFTQEIRLTSTVGPGRLDWLAGLFFVDRDLAWHPSFPAPGFDEATGGEAAAAGNPDNLGSGTTRFDHEQLALYGEVSIDLAPDWTVTFGGRWFRFEESSRQAVKGILGNPEPTLNSADETGFVPKVMVSWAVYPDTLLYASATQGFRPGGPNFAAVPLPLCEDALHSIGLDAAPKSYESDSLWNYELGARATKLDSRLRMSAAAFHMDWSKVQIFAFLSCGSGFMSNAAQARSDGVEAEAEFSATDSLTIGLSGAYIDARVTRDVTVLSVKAGEQMPGVPEFTFQANATWKVQLGDGLDAFLRGAYRYVDATRGIFVPEGAPRLTAPSYQVVDLHLGVERGRWSASVFVDNVLDEYGIVNRVDDTGLHPSGDSQNLIQPRTIGLTVRTRFQ